MQPNSETEVLVVGAGPVGMVMAACLAEWDVRVRIVEQGYRPAARSYALALHPGSLEILDELGLVRQIVERGKLVDRITFWEGERRRAGVDLSALESEFPFVLVLAQSALEEVLARHLRSRQVPVLWNHRGADIRLGGRGMATASLEKVTEESAGYGLVPGRSAVSRPSEVHAHFVVGADGYGSVVRKSLGLDYQDAGGSQTFGVFEIAAEWDAEREVRVVLDTASTNVLWPIGAGRLRWSFELSGVESGSPRHKRRLLKQMGEEAFPYIAQELLEDLIAERAPWFTPQIRGVDWSVAVKFDRRLVPRFGRDTAWLVGDAAHLAAPVGVQSMNVGIREAHDLAGRIQAILRGAAPRRLLEDYNAERMAEWRALFGANGGPGISDETDDWVAVNAARILSAIPASGEHLRRLATQVGLALTPWAPRP
jgi:NADPH-dependent dioxygenase